MSDALPAAAWFADPHDPSRLRWWDGASWTDHVHPPVVPAAPVGAAPVAEVARVVEATPEQQPEERILEEYYGNEKERGMFGGGMSFSVRTQFGNGPSPHGKATISAIEQQGSDAFDEAAERDRLAECGLTPEQIETAIKAHAKMASLVEKAAGHPIASKAAHMVLRKLAFSTARGNEHQAMDIVFDGRRYRAYGGRLND